MEIISNIITITCMLLPSLIAMRLDFKLADNRNSNLYHILKSIFLFSTAIYVALYSIYYLFGLELTHPWSISISYESRTFSFVQRGTILDYWDEFLLSIILAITFGFQWHKLEKVLNRGEKPFTKKTEMSGVLVDNENNLANAPDTLFKIITYGKVRESENLIKDKEFFLEEIAIHPDGFLYFNPKYRSRWEKIFDHTQFQYKLDPESIFRLLNRVISYNGDKLLVVTTPPDLEHQLEDEVCMWSIDTINKLFEDRGLYGICGFEMREEKYKETTEALKFIEDEMLNKCQKYQYEVNKRIKEPHSNEVLNETKSKKIEWKNWLLREDKSVIDLIIIATIAGIVTEMIKEATKYLLLGG